MRFIFWGKGAEAPASAPAGGAAAAGAPGEAQAGGIASLQAALGPILGLG